MTAGNADFRGMRIAALESRRADDMARLIEKHNGVAYVSPSMREVPIETNRQAIDFAYRVITGEISYVIIMTGVGLRYLLKAIERHVDGKQFLNALSDITTVCRGPKPTAVMRELGLTPTHQVGEPNTWRELLMLIDQHAPVLNQKVGLQEYGISNPSLVAGLEARGAEVVSVRVYQWDFPEDPSALEQNIRAICDSQRDALLLTSGHQIVNMLRMAERLNLVDTLRQQMQKVVLASIGPTTTETIEEYDLSVDLEPAHPKMGHLVVETAKKIDLLVSKKRGVRVPGFDRTPSEAHPSHNSLFLRACRGEATERTPIWLMRQAGRYMAEYRHVRAQQSFLDLCKNPQLCSEVMCTAVDRLGVDAAIIFSDLLPILEPMGMDLEYVKGDGPVIHNPIRCADDLDRFRELEDSDALDFVYQTVKQTRTDISDSIPVIGFAGAPFTLASYLIEGKGSRQYVHTKRFMHADQGAWETLMNRLSRAIITYLNQQIDAGAQAVQLFDSWAGCLGVTDYQQYVSPYMQQILAGITPGVPVINFATGNPELLTLLRGDSRTVVGVDWRVPLDVAWKRVGYECSVQGNLDPAVLLSDTDTIRKRVDEVLQKAERRPGHIFNLGHGVLQDTPVENVIDLVNYVKQASAT